jgi:putative Mn2+ efflux pump MntP
MYKKINQKLPLKSNNVEFCSIVVAILKMATGRNFSISGINSGHHNLPIQHCPISTTFHMWIDYDVPNWLLTSKNFYRSPFSKWPPQYRTNSTLFDFNVLCRWNWTMLNLCGIVAAILKMATGRNFSISGINSGHHNLPTYEMALKSVVRFQR